MKNGKLQAAVAAWVTAGVFLVQPPLTLAAAIEADRKAGMENRPLVTETASHVPMVYITTPTAGGVSRNMYSMFNVPQGGAILNNATAMANTKLAGWINMNPFLLGGAAKIIVNEVTSSNPTNINGFLEVAGNKASVVIANPNGIMIHGGGFINTANALLTTGRPGYDELGNLRDIRVEKGTVSVEGAGLNGREADSVSIYARAAKINAELWSNYLKITTGENNINIKTGAVNVLSANGKKPQVALDVSAVGGMYAGVIELIGTEKGLGINNDGTIAASKAISLDENGALHTSGNIYSGGQAKLSVDEIINHEGGHITGDDILLTGRVVRNERNAELEAALQAEQSKLREKEKALEAAYAADITGFRNNSQIAAYENGIKTATEAYDNQLSKVNAAQNELTKHKAGMMKAAKNLNIIAGTFSNTSGAAIQSDGDLGILADDVLNRGALLEAKENIAIQADHIKNENEAFSMKRVSTALVKNPRRIRIDEAGHSERGQVFDASEFHNLGSGYGAYHQGNDGKINDLTFIESSSQTSWETVAVNTPAKLAAGNDMTIHGNVINDNSWLTAGNTIAAIGNLQNIASENQTRTVTFGTTQGSYTYRLHWPHKARVRGYHDVVFMTPQVELGEPQGIDMPEVTVKHTLGNEALNPFHTASVTAHYRYETDSKYTDKHEFLSSDYMDHERLYDPQIVAMQMESVVEGRRASVATGVISAKDIIVTGDDIENTGAIVADAAKLQGEDVRNKGVIAGRKLKLDAQGNLTITGKISADDEVYLSGKNVNIESTTAQYKNQDVVGSVAGIAVNNQNGQLAIKAENNANITGAVVKSAGNVQISAGKNVNLDTQKLHSQKNMTVDSDNYLRTSRDTELTTEIQAGGNLTVDAGQDVNARGSFMGSQNGDLAIRAGQNINLQAGKENSHDAYSLKHKESGLLSSTTTLTRTDDEHETILGTELSGKNISLTADNAIHTEAAQIAADHNVELSAKEIKLGSVAQYDRDQNEKQVKESGLLGNGLGILIGARETKDQASDKYLTQQGTLVGAGGNVNIQGTDKVQITSSEIAAKQGIEIIAPAVTIHGEDNIHEGVRVHEENQSGLSIGLGGKSVAAVESVAQPLRRACDVKDERLKALYAWRAGNNAKNNGKALENLAKGKPDIGLTVGLGASHSESRSEIKEKEYAGSNITARENASLKATEHDLSITGSNVSGQNIHLEAKDDIALKAAKNSSHTEITEHSSNSGISVEYSLGRGAGFSSVNISHNHSDLKGTGEGTTYTGTNIKAGDRLTTKSGKDTEIIGSTASSSKVDMTIGGNLHVETVQDTDNYHETSHSSGFGIDMAKGIRPDYGVNASRGNIDSDYVGTTKQAGIYAGKEGFNIRTEKNTHLKGAVIASEAEAEENKLSTGSLSWEDIENKTEYDARSIGFDYHKYGDFNKKSKQSQNDLYKTKGLSPSLGMPAHGDDKNTTHAAIAPGNIEIRNGQKDISGLSRDTQNSLSILGKIFDKSTIEEQQELAKVFGEEAYKLAHNMKDDGSARKIAVHAAIGGIMSQITGAGFASGAVGAGVNEAIIHEISKIKDPGTAQVVSSIIGAAAAKAAGGNAGAGATVAASGTRNNRLYEYQVENLKSRITEAMLSGADTERLQSIIYEYWKDAIEQYGDDDESVNNANILKWFIYGDRSNESENLKSFINDYFGYNWDDALQSIKQYKKNATDLDVWHNLFNHIESQAGAIAYKQHEMQAYAMENYSAEDTLEAGFAAVIEWDGDTANSLIDKNGNRHWFSDTINKGDWYLEHGEAYLNGRYYDNGTAAVTINGKDYPAYNAPVKGDVMAENPSAKWVPMGNGWAIEDSDGTAWWTNKQPTSIYNTSQKVVDFFAGATTAIDDNMGLGLGQSVYKGVTGRDITYNTSAYYTGRVVGDVVSGIAGTATMIGGMGEATAGGYFSGYSGGLTLAVATDGLGKTAYGFATVKNSVSNFSKDTNTISEKVKIDASYIKENRVPQDQETFLHGKDYKRTKYMYQKAVVYEKDGMYYYRDKLHKGDAAHIEVFNKKGEHIGEANPITGEIDYSKADKNKRLKLK